MFTIEPRTYRKMIETPKPKEKESKELKPMFSITEGKGFQMTFGNGITLSVQFGKQNYCANNAPYRGRYMPTFNDYHTTYSCENAEVAVWRKNEPLDAKLITQVFGEPEPEPDEDGLIWSDTVRGWVEPDKLAEVITRIAAL